MSSRLANRSRNRSQSSGLALLTLALLLPTCDDSTPKGVGVGTPSGQGGAGGGPGGQGGGFGGFTGGQGGSFGFGGSVLAKGGAGGGLGPARGGSGGSNGPDGGGGDGGTGTASIKFCNMLVFGPMDQEQPTTIELAIGGTKLASTTFACGPAPGTQCVTIGAGTIRVTMTVIAPQMQVPVIYDQQHTFVAGSQYLAFSDFDEMTMKPVLVLEPVPASVTCPSFTLPPSPTKFCNRVTRGGASVTLDLNLAGLKFRAPSGTCTPAANQACMAVPSGVQNISITDEAGMSVIAGAVLFAPGIETVLYAGLEGDSVAFGGRELPETTKCSTLDYQQVDNLLNMAPPSPLQRTLGTRAIRASH